MNYKSCQSLCTTRPRVLSFNRFIHVTFNRLAFHFLFQYFYSYTFIFILFFLNYYFGLKNVLLSFIQKYFDACIFFVCHGVMRHSDLLHLLVIWLLLLLLLVFFFFLLFIFFGIIQGETFIIMPGGRGWCKFVEPVDEDSWKGFFREFCHSKYSRRFVKLISYWTKLLSLTRYPLFLIQCRKIKKKWINIQNDYNNNK